MMDDKTIINRITNGNKNAFRWLIVQHQDMVYAFVFKMVKNQVDAEDICQETFIQVYEKIEQFHFNSKLSTWIITIAYRRALAFLKKKKRAPISFEKEAGTMEEMEKADNPLETLERKEKKVILAEAIEALPSHYGIILRMYHIEEFSLKEIGKVLALPPGTVRNYLFRARKLLLKKIQQSHPEIMGHKLEKK